MSADESSDEARAALRALAEFCGRLLVRELGPEDLAALREPGTADALAGVGLELPDPGADGPWLDELAADYHERFLRPESGPLVQSLHTQGRYEGDAAVRVRALATAAGLAFDSPAARGAAPDHLGSLLLLWAATDGRAQAVADEVAARHLAWALPALRRMDATDGFYPALCAATAGLIEALSEPAPTS